MAYLEKFYYQCPHCGYKNYQFYDPSREAPPHYFRCSDCHRHFGDENRMSFSEKEVLYREEHECQRTMLMPELNTVFYAVENFFRQYRPGTGVLPIILIRDGKIENTRYSTSTNQRTTQLLATYSVTSPTSDQWLCTLCYYYLKKYMPYINFNLGDFGISI